MIVNLDLLGVFPINSGFSKHCKKFLTFMRLIEIGREPYFSCSSFIYR